MSRAAYSRDKVGPEAGEGLNHALPAWIPRRGWPVHLGDLGLRLQEKNDPRLGQRGEPRARNGTYGNIIDQTIRISLGHRCHEESRVHQNSTN